MQPNSTNLLKDIAERFERIQEEMDEIRLDIAEIRMQEAGEDSRRADEGTT